jgi:rhodanese-related sulfurtransferase
MKSSVEVAVLLVVAVGASVATWAAGGRPSGRPEVELAKAPLRPGEVRLEQLRQEGFDDILWVDAREREAWQRDGVVGSIHLSVQSPESLELQIERHLEALATASRVVVYCNDLHCALSHQLAEALRGMGLIPGRIEVLKGGMVALRQSDLPRRDST